mmetsp:Transcript_9031/g.26577  ORF Transcript_9031/g.26577 Transcript_9031/m.26577 type:complete len:207 (-) Transcript_9031:1889-2509(-)
MSAASASSIRAVPVALASASAPRCSSSAESSSAIFSSHQATASSGVGSSATPASAVAAAATRWGGGETDVDCGKSSVFSLLLAMAARTACASSRIGAGSFPASVISSTSASIPCMHAIGSSSSTAATFSRASEKSAAWRSSFRSRRAAVASGLSAGTKLRATASSSDSWRNTAACGSALTWVSAATIASSRGTVFGQSSTPPVPSL